MSSGRCKYGRRILYICMTFFNIAVLTKATKEREVAPCSVRRATPGDWPPAFESGRIAGGACGRG